MQAGSSAHSRSATPLTSVCTFDPPSASSVTSSPTTLLTRYGPPMAMDDVPRTMGTKSASPGMYAVPAAPGPSMAATNGTTPDITTCSRKRYPVSAKELIHDASSGSAGGRAPGGSISQTNG